VKQFAQCSNCQQWFIRSFTTAVEIHPDDHLRQVTLWCLHCMAAAEQRSQSGREDESEMSAWQEGAAPAASLLPDDVPDTNYQQIIQEHSDLMERALREDDAVLVPIVEAFMQRCLLYQEQEAIPEQAKRLLGHAQYWQAFLKALNQSLS
jgi:hypothetical protein